jgi:hypothetical protein
MKTSKEIISHIISKPQNSKIVQKGCIDKLISCLPPHLANAVMFTYIKNRTLFFVLNHPGLKMEFNYKHNLIKSLLNKIKDIDLKCKIIDVDNINSFVSNKIAPPQKKIEILTYEERSSGDFKNYATGGLQELFENIKKSISENTKNNNH